MYIYIYVYIMWLCVCAYMPREQDPEGLGSRAGGAPRLRGTSAETCGAYRYIYICMTYIHTSTSSSRISATMSSIPPRKLSAWQ